MDTTHLDSPPKPKVVPDWPEKELNVGQISAVAIDNEGNPVIFHRAGNVWDETWVFSKPHHCNKQHKHHIYIHSTFNETNHYQHANLGPISVNTILTLDSKTGAIQNGRGANLFYMPHGLTFDRHGNIWVTDVALHQVMKFHRDVSDPVITIGIRFSPGSLANYLCKPTAVAVASSGEVRF